MLSLTHSLIYHFADDSLNMDIKGFLNTDCRENIVEKGEIAQSEQFHLFSTMFS